MTRRINAIRTYYDARPGSAAPPPDRMRREMARLALVRPRRGSIRSRVFVAACALAFGLTLASLPFPSPLAGQAAAFCQKYEVGAKFTQSLEFLQELFNQSFQGGI